MILPPIHQSILHKDFFVFASCDSIYFDSFGKSLINSLLKNTDHKIHLHIFNPRKDQLDFCSLNNRILVTYEFIKLDDLTTAAEKWSTTDAKSTHNYKRIVTAMEKGNDSSIVERIQKTYFACARFIRLNEISQHVDTFFAIDVDAIVRKDIPVLPTNFDIYMYKVLDKNPRWLAGGIYVCSNKGKEFVNEYADTLEKNIKNDILYWGLDQDVLNDIVPRYNWGMLSKSLIDWDMQDSSIIWTAKGTRKDLDKFIFEAKSYAS